MTGTGTRTGPCPGPKTFSGDAEVWPANLTKLLRHKNNLKVVQGVAMYKDRPIVPPWIRAEVLDTVHSGHQGAASMVARISNSVWWPGMNDDIRTMRANCRMCNSYTPSKAKEPPVPLPDLQYPFQQICSDYFTLEARHYLVIINRYSGWPSAQLAQKGNASELINFLCTQTFGAPELLILDVGPQCISAQLRTFLETWGINHRLSSAYNPHRKTLRSLVLSSRRG